MAHNNRRPASSAWPSHAYQNLYEDQYEEQSYDHQPPVDSARSHQHHHQPQSARKAYVVERTTPPRADASAARRSRQDPDREQSRTYPEEDYSHQSAHLRSRSRSPRGAPPNSTVILDGTMDLTQEDIINELQKRLQVDGIQDIRLIKDKRTGQSRQFAFAQFVGIPEATLFLSKYYPILHLYGPYDPAESGNVESIPVRIAYCREKEERERGGRGDDDWKCDVCFVSNFSHRNLCFRCNAPRTRSTANGIVVQAMSSHSGFMTTGESDASPDGMASQFILVRGLEPGANEELLARGVSKLYKTRLISESAEPRVKKPKISSTTDDASLGAKNGSLRRVLLMRDRKSGDSWRYGFAEFNTVEDAQAAMTKFRSLEKFTISSKPVTLSYIHAGVFVPVLQAMDQELIKFTFSPLSNAATRLMYWDESAYASEFVVAAMDHCTGSSRKNENEHARLAAAAQNEGLIKAGKDGEPKSKKRRVEKDSKVVVPRLQFWTNQHAELHGKSTKETTSADATSSIDDTEVGELSLPPASKTFADVKRKCCFLCSRQFKTEAELDKHSRLSQLHRDNLEDKELVVKAEAKMTKSADPGLDTSAYRDRAKERRSAFNQPKQPTAQHKRPSKEVTPEEEISAPIQSKGAALLGKMGWSVGEGLGATGSGRKEAITTHLYSQGVGLGASGGKVGDAAEEAQRQTSGSYTDFVLKAKEKAKARFESLGEPIFPHLKPTPKHGTLFEKDHLATGGQSMALLQPQFPMAGSLSTSTVVKGTPPPDPQSAFTSPRARRQLGLFAAGAGFFMLSTAITRRSIVRRYKATVPKFYHQSNRMNTEINGAMEAFEALNIATINVLSVGMMSAGGLLWAFDISSLDDMRRKVRTNLGVDSIRVDQDAEQEIEEWFASVLARKEFKALRGDKGIKDVEVTKREDKNEEKKP